MSNDFVRHSKLGRKIIELEKQQNEGHDDNSLDTMRNRFVFMVLLKVAYGLINMIFMYFFRYSYVYRFRSDFSLSPLSNLLSYPITDQSNVISVPFFLLLTNLFIQLVC